MKIFMLYDWPCKKVHNEATERLKTGLQEQGNRIYSDGSSRKKPRPLYYLLLAIRTIFRSRKEDIIVSWYDFIAVLTYWIGALTFRKRKIVAINILLKEKSTLTNRIIRFLYYRAYKSKTFYTTYTSRYILPKHPNAFLLNDTYVDRDKYSSPYKDCGRVVCCAGSNGRDWRHVFKVAAQMPETKFIVIMPTSARRWGGVPNVKTYCNISHIEYLKLLEQSSIVFLPLNTNAPAGLIVVYEAALKSKCIIITENNVTKEYIQHQENGILINTENASESASIIDYYLRHETERKRIAQNAQTTLKEVGSMKRYIETLNIIIKQISDEKVH